MRPGAGRAGEEGVASGDSFRLGEEDGRTARWPERR